MNERPSLAITASFIWDGSYGRGMSSPSTTCGSATGGGAEPPFPLPAERPIPRSKRPGYAASSRPNSSTTDTGVRWPIWTAPEPSLIVEVAGAVRASITAGDVPATPGLKWCSAYQ
jgi:hypothetical protein